MQGTDLKYLYIFVYSRGSWRSLRTTNGPGRNRMIGTVERWMWEKTHSQFMTQQNRGRPGGIKDMRKNESRTQGVNKMDTATNSQSYYWKGKMWKKQKGKKKK